MWKLYMCNVQYNGENDRLLHMTETEAHTQDINAPHKHVHTLYT